MEITVPRQMKIHHSRLLLYFSNAEYVWRLWNHSPFVHGKANDKFSLIRQVSSHCRPYYLIHAQARYALAIYILTNFHRISI